MDGHTNLAKGIFHARFIPDRAVGEPNGVHVLCGCLPEFHGKVGPSLTWPRGGCEQGFVAGPAPSSQGWRVRHRSTRLASTRPSASTPHPSLPRQVPLFTSCTKAPQRWALRRWPCGPRAHGPAWWRSPVAKCSVLGLAWERLYRPVAPTRVKHPLGYPCKLPPALRVFYTGTPIHAARIFGGAQPPRPCPRRPAEHEAKLDRSFSGKRAGSAKGQGRGGCRFVALSGLRPAILGQLTAPPSPPAYRACRCTCVPCHCWRRTRRGA